MTAGVITKRFEAQRLLVKHVDIILAEVVTAVDKEAIWLPPNSVIVAGSAFSVTAWDSTSTDVLDVGDSASQNRYLNDGNIRAVNALVPLVPTGFVHPGGYITARWTSGGGTPTTGKTRLAVQFYILDKGEMVMEP